jgi:ABC-type multidrug transport system fused ATPase/permease subunit
VRDPTPLNRLFQYTRPYRGRLAWAVLGMVIYAAGTAGLAYLVKYIIDDILIDQNSVKLITWLIVAM